MGRGFLSFSLFLLLFSLFSVSLSLLACSLAGPFRWVFRFSWGVPWLLPRSLSLLSLPRWCCPPAVPLRPGPVPPWVFPSARLPVLSPVSSRSSGFPLPPPLACSLAPGRGALSPLAVWCAFARSALSPVAGRFLSRLPRRPRPSVAVARPAAWRRCSPPVVASSVRLVAVPRRRACGGGFFWRSAAVAGFPPAGLWRGRRRGRGGPRRGGGLRRWC